MRLIQTLEEARGLGDEALGNRQKIGFVPTMGALHEGHLALVRTARAQSDICVASIFVNPTQFAPTEDFDAYPRPFEKDLEQLRRLSVDWVFAPRPDDMYPSGFSTYVQPPKVSQRWEGAHRPEHFRGVTTVVLKLINVVRPRYIFLGEKDYQQLQVVRRMVLDLGVPVQVVGCPTVRDKDGLALSSRNAYLSEADRTRALAISQSLQLAEKLFSEGERSAETIGAAVRKLLENSVDEIDYVAVADPWSLEPLNTIGTSAVVLIAVRMGGTRLIDNRVVGYKSS